MERPLIKTDLSAPVLEPDILFAQGSSELKPVFRTSNGLFPRYVKILTSPSIGDAITEIVLRDIHHRIGSVVRRPTTPICTTWSFLSTDEINPALCADAPRDSRRRHCSVAW